MITTKKKVISIVILITVILLFHFYKMNIGFKWETKFELPNNYNIVDTIQYDLEYATLLLEKNEVVEKLNKTIDNYNLYADNIGSNDIYLRNHLDSISDKFVVKKGGSYSTKLDTMSIAQFKIMNGIHSIEDGDWAKDTLGMEQDFTDTRNFFFHSINLIAVELLNEKKVILLDKATQQPVYNIKLKHHSWGYSSYSSNYEFEWGVDIIGKDFLIGL